MKKEEIYEFPLLGEYIGQVRKEYGLGVREVCNETGISSRYYSKVRIGEDRKLNCYLRTFAIVVDRYAKDQEEKDRHYREFFRRAMCVVYEKERKKEEKEEEQRRKKRWSKSI